MEDETSNGAEGSSDGPPPARQAYEHAWNWFKYHAEQRLAMIRFAVLILGAIAAAVGYLHKDNQFVISIALCLLGMVASYCFLKLDSRTSHLIKLAEEALAEHENKLAEDISSSKIKIFQNTDALRTFNLGTRDGRVLWSKWWNYPYTYKQNFRLLFIISIVLYYFVLCYELILYLRRHR